mmetsp:Transcript_35296/g.89595  ORF Transcript_35296/g.89595 Transcript_35296/m.89595 type:complete len:230 (+) Transcript_35296:534-1223(+)
MHRSPARMAQVRCNWKRWHGCRWPGVCWCLWRRCRWRVRQLCPVWRRSRGRRLRRLRRGRRRAALVLSQSKSQSALRAGLPPSAFPPPALPPRRRRQLRVRKPTAPRRPRSTPSSSARSSVASARQWSRGDELSCPWPLARHHQGHYQAWGEGATAPEGARVRKSLRSSRTRTARATSRPRRRLVGGTRIPKPSKHARLCAGYPAVSQRSGVRGPLSAHSRVSSGDLPG